MAEELSDFVFYRFRTARDIALESLAHELEVRGWEREETSPNRITLGLEDFVPTLGLAAQPDERALVIVSDQRMVLANSAKPAAAVLAFVTAFAVAVALLVDLDTAVFVLVVAIVVAAWPLLFVFRFGARFGLRPYPSTARAHVVIVRDKGVLVELSLEAGHYVHDAAVEQRLGEDLRVLVDATE